MRFAELVRAQTLSADSITALLKIANIVLAVLLLLYLTILILSPHSLRHKSLSLATATSHSSGPGDTSSRETLELKPLNQYAAMIQGRQLFRSVSALPQTVIPAKPPVALPVATKPEEAKPKLTDLARGLVLNGIVSGSNAQAIIADAGTGRTYFLSTGDSVKGITVKAIKSDLVVLVLGDEELELRM